LAALVALIGVTAATAHEGDPKLRDWMGMIPGKVWRLGDPTDKSESFRSDNIRLLAHFPLNAFAGGNTSGNDCWGYTSPSGREYAIIGLSHGTGFVEVTNPSTASIVAFKARNAQSSSSLWRDIKVYKQYAYSVTEGGGGIQVFDMSQIDQGVVDELASVDATAGTAATHNVALSSYTDSNGNPQAFLYRCGGGSQGLRIYALEPTTTQPTASPAAPRLVGSWSTKYVHDAVPHYFTSGPYAGRELIFCCGGLNGGQTDTGVDILDVTNKSAITVVGRFTYANASYCHQAWLSADARYLYINDELDDNNRGIFATGRIADVSNPAAPFLAGTYAPGVRSIDHNCYTRSNLLFCANYSSGLQVFDVTAGSTATRVGFFDTHPNDDASSQDTFNGAWSVYPYFPSGTVIVSDIERGLFVLGVGPEPVVLSLPDGQPEFFDPRGQTIRVQTALQPGVELGPDGVMLETVVDGVPTITPLNQSRGGTWQGNAPVIDCGKSVSWRVVAALSDGGQASLPATGVFEALSGLGLDQAVRDACESSTGWSASLSTDNATTGRWVNAVPVSTSVAPGSDVSADGTRCWVTGNGAVGGADGAADVDGGTTTLTSPAYSLAGLEDPRVSYHRWYSNNGGAAPNEDSMPVQISGDGGASWTQLELVVENAGAWVRREFRVFDFVSPSSQSIQLRFIARDLGSGSLVEAGVDEIAISATACPEASAGDFDANGTVDAGDIGLLLLQFGACPQPCAADLDGNGTVDSGDLGLLLLLFG
jgi:choice-of-anchor B domain-containing protein